MTPLFPIPPAVARPLAIVAMVWAAIGVASCTHWSGEADRDPAGYAERLLAAGDTARAIARLETTDLDTAATPDMAVTLAALYRAQGSIVGRLRAQRVLERALQVHPGDSRLLYELGRTYYEQTFYPDAMRTFRAALAADSTLCRAYHYLALYHYEKWKRVNTYIDDLDTARVYFERELECAPGSVDASLHYASSLYALGRPDSSLAACERLLARPDAPAGAVLLRGVIAYDDGRFDDAAGDFARGLARLDSTTRAAYEDLTPFLSHRDRQVYTTAPPAERKAYDRSYWLDLDTDPTTPENRRRLEHVYRVVLADLFFSCTRPPRRGWETERGQALIKFGWPLSIESTLGGGFRDGRQETWTYVIDGEVLEFIFVDEYLNGNLRIPYRADALVSVLQYAPRETNTGPGFIPVPGTLDVFAFKDTDMSATLVLAAAVHADSIADAVDRFHLRVSLFDPDWHLERYVTDTLSTSEIPTVVEATTRTREVACVLSIPFGEYQVAVALADGYETATSVMRGYGDARRYAGDRLAVSDILLQRHGGAGPSFDRGGEILRPNPGRRYRPGQRLTVYFEVYNLGVVAGASDYTVTFSIYDAAPEPDSPWRRWGKRLAAMAGRAEAPTISQRFERGGALHREHEMLGINIDALDPGHYELVVAVADRVTGNAAESRTTFVKLERGATGPAEGGD